MLVTDESHPKLRAILLPHPRGHAMPQLIGIPFFDTRHLAGVVNRTTQSLGRVMVADASIAARVPFCMARPDFRFTGLAFRLDPLSVRLPWREDVGR